MLKTMGRPKGTEPPKVSTATRLPRPLYDWMEARAKAEERTLSQLIYFAVKEYHDRRSGAEKPDKPKR